MNGLLREFMRPIPDCAVPVARDSMVRGVTILTFIATILAPLFTLMMIPIGFVDPRRCVLQSLAFAGGFFAIHLAGRSRHGMRRPEQILVALVLVAAAAVAFSGWSTLDHVNNVPFYTLFIPAIVASFVPWRPSFSLGLVPPLFAIWYAGQRVAGPAVSATEIGVALIVLPLNAVIAAVANQSHRRLWARLEKARAELAASDRMYGLGCLTAGIAHELKTPVASALNSLETARALAAELGESIDHPQVTGDDLRQIAAEIDQSIALARRSTERTASFVQAIREQTRNLNELTRVEVIVSACVDSVAMLLSHRLKQSRVRLDTSGVDPAIGLVGDPGKLDQILTNLITNALDACDESGKGTTVRVVTALRDGGLVIAVEDDGPGVPKELLQRIFEPLFTTRTGTGGSGLGLAISRDLAEGAFGGQLVLTSLAQGSRFELWVPRQGAEPRTQPAWRPAGAGLASIPPAPRSVSPGAMRVAPRR